VRPYHRGRALARRSGKPSAPRLAGISPHRPQARLQAQLFPRRYALLPPLCIFALSVPLPLISLQSVCDIFNSFAGNFAILLSLFLQNKPNDNK